MPSVPARAEIGLSLCAWAIGGVSFARGLEGLGGATYYNKALAFKTGEWGSIPH